MPGRDPRSPRLEQIREPSSSTQTRHRPDRAGRAGPGRLRSRLPAAAGEAGELRRADRLLDRGRYARSAYGRGLEGYGPPPDPRIKTMMVTPDPGVIEVNVQPTSSWAEHAELTHTLYENARERGWAPRRSTSDGRHSGTGGGNHITLGGSRARRSPLLRRPDLLVSCSPTGSATRRCRICSPAGSSARPPRRRGSTRAGRRRCTSWRSPSPRSNDLAGHRDTDRGRSTGRCGTC